MIEKTYTITDADNDSIKIAAVGSHLEVSIGDQRVDLNIAEALELIQILSVVTEDLYQRSIE